MGLGRAAEAHLLASGHIVDLVSRHDAWDTLEVGAMVAFACGVYAVNIFGIAYKIPINGMGPDHELYRGAVAWARVGAAVFALVGLYMAARSVDVLVN